MDYYKKYCKCKAKYLNIKQTGAGNNKQKCIKSTLKKYTNRPSPPYPAKMCTYLIKKGNDGKMWISMINKKGVYRWIKYTKPKPLKFKAKYKIIHNKKDLEAYFMKYRDDEGDIIENDTLYGARKFAKYVQSALRNCLIMVLLHLYIPRVVQEVMILGAIL